MDLRTATGVHLGGEGGTRSHQILYMPIRDLIEADHNPKIHDDAAIRASITRFGYIAPMIIDERTERIVVGHGRLTALLNMRSEKQPSPAGVRVDADGQWLAPVLRGWSSRSDTEASAYLVADNQLTMLGGWDNEALQMLLSDIGDQDPELIELTGVDMDALAALCDMPVPDLDQPPAGQPEPSGWVMVRVEVPPHVAAAWRSHVETFGDGRDSEAAAMASLLGVRLDP